MSEELKPAAVHDANVFLPGSLGPVRREVVLAYEHDRVVNQLRAELAALKAGQGEAVEVVAWRSERYICGESHYSPPRLTFEQPYSTDRNCEPLMTVAQHERIVAAISAPPTPADARLVPVELLERVCVDRCYPAGHTMSIRAIDELRALLAQSESKGMEQ